MRNNKKGNYIMEAALVLPMVVLTVITTVLIVMFFYMGTWEKAHMHISLRAAAGSFTGKTTCEYDGMWTGEIAIDKKVIGGKACGKGYVVMNNRGLLAAWPEQNIEGTYYATDGPKYVRYCNLAKSMSVEKSDGNNEYR